MVLVSNWNMVGLFPHIMYLVSETGNSVFFFIERNMRSSMAATCGFDSGLCYVI